jgi:hypothetical protein
MTKRNFANNFRSLSFAVAFTLLASASFYSCKKAADTPAAIETAEQPSSDDRLLSVANVYYEADGRTITVLFYETPLVHSISRASGKAEPLMKLLQEAKTRQLPVNVRVAKGKEDLIESVIPATETQVKAYQEAKAKAEAAEQVEDPETMARNGANGRATLAAVIPNLATLNTIFNTLRNQGCRAAGPYLYGQCIPFQYVADGCYARAHKMRQIIEGTYGYTSYKAFNYADQCPAVPGVLAVSATLWGNNCCVRWWYHVAPYVFVQSGASQVAYLLDPSMHTAPVAISTWLNAQKNVGCGYTAGTLHKQAYYTSSAYAPSGFNYGTCTMTVAGDNTYTAANNTCAAYAPLQGCF